MGSSSAIEFNFGFDCSKLESGAAKAQAIIARSMGKISASSVVAFATVAGATAEAFAKMAAVASSTAEKVRGVFEQGAQLQALSQQTGIATGRLFMMSQAFKSVDVDAQKLGPSMARMQHMLNAAAQGSKAGSAAFENIGIQFKDLAGISPDKQFQAVATAIAGMASPTERVGAAMSIFGRAGAELLPLFNNAGAVSRMGGALSTQAKVFAQNSEKFHEAAEGLRKAGEAFQGFYQGLAAGLVDSFNEVLKRAGATSFIQAGKQAGEVIGKVISGLVSAWDNMGKIGKYIESVFCNMVGYSLDAVNVLWKGIQSVGSLFEAAWMKVISLGAGLTADLLSMPITLTQMLAGGLMWAFQKAHDFFDGSMWTTIKNLAAAFGAYMKQAVAKIFDSLSSKLKKWLGIGIDEYKAAAAGVEKLEHKIESVSFADVEKGIVDGMQTALGGYYGMIDTLRDTSTKFGDKAGKAMNDAFHPKGMTGGMDPAAWHRSADEFWNAAHKPNVVRKAAAAVAASRSAPQRPLHSLGEFGVSGWIASLADKSAASLNNPHGVSGLGNNAAYGYVRHGDAARRRAADQSAEKERAKKEADAANKSAADTEHLATIASGVEETNSKLDQYFGE